MNINRKITEKKLMIKKKKFAKYFNYFILENISRKIHNILKA